jgi:hypothetical protein
LGIDCNDIILNDIYGQQELYLKIVLNTEEGMPSVTLNLHLLYLQSNVALIPKITKSLVPEQQWQLQTIEFSTVPIYASNLMGMFINDIYQETDGPNTGIEIIKKTLTKYGFTYQIDNTGSATTPFTQIIIPPMSFRQMVDYIDKYVGIYNGPLFYNCDDDGTFKMWDLSQRIKRPTIFTVYQMGGGSDPQETSNELKKTLSPQDNVYITSEAIQTIYHSNANILKYGYSNLHITHPSSSIYDLKSGNVDTIATSFGISNANKSLIFNPLLMGRKKYAYSTSGERGNDVVTSEFSSNIAKLSTLQMTVKRDIKIDNIIRVGEPVIFEPTTLEYLRYRGKYILESYDLQLSMAGSDNWDSLCQIRMFRATQQQ